MFVRLAGRLLQLGRQEQKVDAQLDLASPKVGIRFRRKISQQQRCSTRLKRSSWYVLSNSLIHYIYRGSYAIYIGAHMRRHF